MTSDPKVPKGERLYVQPNKKVNEMTPEEVNAFAQSVANRMSYAGKLWLAEFEEFHHVT